MNSKSRLSGLSIALALQLGMLAGSAQTNKYLFTERIAKYYWTHARAWLIHEMNSARITE